MKVNIFTNSQKPIAELVEELIANSSDIFLASAYISEKAVSTLLQRCNSATRSDLKRVEILFGVDFETQPSALHPLLDAAKQSPDVFHIRYTPNQPGRLFHPKAYFFQHGDSCNIIVASANLTHRGQHTNEEIYCRIECSAATDLVQHFNAIRKAWFSAPFSKPLDDKVVNPLEALIQAQHDLAEILKGALLVIDPPPPTSPQSRILDELNKGYLVSADFSIAPLSVPVPIKANDGGNSVSGNVVVVRSTLAASVQLLPDEIYDQFDSLNQQARRAIEDYSVAVPSGGYYIPYTAHKSFVAKVRSLKSKHKDLINKHVRLKTPINNHLKQHLTTGISSAWDTHKHIAGVLSQNQMFQSAQLRIAKRRKEFSQNPFSAARFVINPYPHPLVSRAQEPHHVAWELSKDKLEEDILANIIALLIKQVDTIIEATTKKTQPAVKDALKQAALFACVHGNEIDKLLKNLANVAGKNWNVAQKRVKAKQPTTTPGKMMIAELVKINKAAKEHRAWLDDVNEKSPQEAFAVLLEQYPNIGK